MKLESFSLVGRVVYAAKHRLRALLKNALSLLGAAWLVLQLVAFSFEEARELRGSAALLFWLILSAFVYGMVKATPKVRIHRRFRSNGVEIEIRVGDLLSENNDIAIISGVYFDTAPDITASNSLIGKIVERFFSGNLQSLDKAIVDSLTSRQIPPEQVRPERTPGKKRQYRYGTIASVDVPDREATSPLAEESRRRLHLVAATDVDFNATTSATVESVWAGLCGLWRVVEVECNLRPLSIPVWGAGLARAPASRIALVQLALISFVMASRNRKISDKLTVVIYPSDFDAEEMVELEHFLETLEM